MGKQQGRHGTGGWAKARRLVDRLPPPREITGLQFIIYVTAAIGGVSALINPPSTVTGQWGPILTMAWALFQATGGIIAAPATLKGLWMIEKPALISVATGITMYATGVLAAHVTEDGNRIPQLSVIIITIIYLISRYIRIHKYAYEPGR